MGQSASTPTETTEATGTSISTTTKHKSSKPVVLVTEINIYPVKSCAEISVTSAPVTSFGFKGDRRFQVVAEVDGKYVFCTPRNKACEKLFHVMPALNEDGTELHLSSKNVKVEKFVLNLKDAETKTIRCTTMGDDEHELLDYGDKVANWLEKATLIANCRLVGLDYESFKREMKVNPDQGEELPSLSHPVSLADEAPFLLCSEESLADLNIRLTAKEKKEVDMRRFRPNIVISGLRPYEEDIPKRIKIGSVEFAVWQRCGRCVMTTINRDTLNRKGGEPLKTLSTYRERDNGQRNFGMHLIPLSVSGASTIKVGDVVEVLEIEIDRETEWKKKHYRWDQ